MAETKIRASQTDLISGENITLSQKYSEGGIDENTLACFHFDGTLKDEVSGNYAIMSDAWLRDYSDSADTFKFDKSISLNSGSYTYGTLPTTLSLESNFTIDFWQWFDTDGWEGAFIIGDNYSVQNNGVYFYLSSTYLRCNQGSVHQDYDFAKISGLHHIALQLEEISSEYYLRFFLDGIEQTNKKLNNWSSIDISYFGNGGMSYGYIDELRISNVVRYDGNFTPPSEPYSPISLLGTAINFDPTSISGYSSSGTKTLKLVDGVLTWVAE